MGKKYDEVDYVSEQTFKKNLPKIYHIVVEEALKVDIDLAKYRFVSCTSVFDIFDIQYSNDEYDFDVSLKGSLTFGFRVIWAGLSDCLIW